MKLRRVLALLFVCALLCGALPISVFAEPQPLKNGGFETGNTEGWYELDGVTVSTDAAYKGEYGCVLAGDGGWNNLLYQTFPVLPGHSYTLTFYYKAVSMGVSWYLFDDNEAGTRMARGWADKTTWTCVTKDFTATSESVCLLFRCSGSNVAELVYLDCVDITIHPCEDHAYSYPCDTVCDICGDVRTDIGEHTYSFPCDSECDYCGDVRTDIGEHTYSYPCDTQCDYCDYVRTDIGEHTYSYPCDTQCDYCDHVRTDIGDHYFDHACDTECNNCGFTRPPSGEHTYDFPCATLCNYCGAPRESEGEHTYDDVCDTICNYCSEVRKVDHFYDYPCAPQCNRCGTIREDEGEHTYSYGCDTECDYCDHVRTEVDYHTYSVDCDAYCDYCDYERTDIGEHTYDDIYDADCNLCGGVRIPAPRPVNRLTAGGAACSYDSNGVGFRFYLEATNGQMLPNNQYVKKSAKVCPFNNGVEYSLVRMGAVMSNETDPILDLEHLSSRTMDIKATFLCHLTEDQLTFAVRIVNIPTNKRDVIIWARPYYIYSDGKNEIVVYGDAVARSFASLEPTE